MLKGVVLFCPFQSILNIGKPKLHKQQWGSPDTPWPPRIVAALGAQQSSRLNTHGAMSGQSRFYSFSFCPFGLAVCSTHYLAGNAGDAGDAGVGISATRPIDIGASFPR